MIHAAVAAAEAASLVAGAVAARVYRVRCRWCSSLIINVAVECIDCGRVHEPVPVRFIEAAMARGRKQK